MGKIVKVWGEGRKKLWSYGQSVDIPAEYTEVTFRSQYDSWRVRPIRRNIYLRMRKTCRGSKPVALLAPPALMQRALGREKKATKRKRTDGRVRKEAARRAAETRRTRRLLSATQYGRLLLALQAAQKASDSAKARAANGVHYDDYSDGSRYASAMRAEEVFTLVLFN